MSSIRTNISQPEWSDSLQRLRDARALVLRDAESFHEAAMILERIGQLLSGRVRNGLGYYTEELMDLAKVADFPKSDEALSLFDTVREARNMAVHEGAWARHLSSRLVDLFLILEQAIMTKMKCANDIMVRQPVVAETWHLVAHVRQTMLANSFSSLPVLVKGRWHLINDLMVMRFVQMPAKGKVKKDRLSMQLGAAIEQKQIVPMDAQCFAPNTKLTEIIEKMHQGPVLVTDDNATPPRLVGILSSFDLL